MKLKPSFDSAVAIPANNLWSDPRLVYGVAVAAVVLLAITIWLFRRSKRDGRAAGVICLVLSVMLHGALIWLVPYQAMDHGGSAQVSDVETDLGVELIPVSVFDAEADLAEQSGQDETSWEKPLPVDELDQLLSEPPSPRQESHDVDSPTESETQAPADSPPDTTPLSETPPADDAVLPESLQAQPVDPFDAMDDAIDSLLDDLLAAQTEATEAIEDASSDPGPVPDSDPAPNENVPSEPKIDPHRVASRPAASATAASARVPGGQKADFAGRVGSAKQQALTETGGDLQTEAAVQAALRFLAQAQRRDGAWDARASGAGIERQPLGERRFGAGTKSTTALTGLSLLAMIGAGNTHRRGDYADNVYKGLAYLIQNQHPDGSLSGDATLYAASYCHSMASLAMCEAAAITKDESAIESCKRAVTFTLQMQHPVTGGWRYTRGAPGDLSQLGWQAMVLDGARRAGVDVPQERMAGVSRFLRSVRAGGGGLASYRRGEAPSRTMTAEALATRLLMGERVPSVEIKEAERYLLSQRPGVSQDNYYYWYYATVALHQLQDDAWQQWNQALKSRLLATQRPDGSWSNESVWGGYGGPIYTTAMATLCLETYYRHSIRSQP